jgi:hypothetical protein
MLVNPAKLRAAIELAMERRAVDADKMNAEEWALFRFICAGLNDPFAGADSEIRLALKDYLEYGRMLDEARKA